MAHNLPQTPRGDRRGEFAMSQINDNLFGLHTQALGLWQKRAEVLSGNLANADTPDYLARDVDFRKALTQASGSTLALSAPTAGQNGPKAKAGGEPALPGATQTAID